MTTPEQAPADQVREALVERVADAIQQRMGPLFGSPEYLADPVKRARAEKRQRDAAMSNAEIAVSECLAAMQNDRFLSQPTPGDGERGAVVAWLRGEGGNFQSPVARDIVRQIAAEIERGDHLSSDAGKQS